MINKFYFDVTQWGRRLTATVLISIISLFGSLSADAAPWGPWSLPNDWLQNCLIYTFVTIDKLQGRTEIYADETQTKPYRSDVCSLGDMTIDGNDQMTSIPSGAPELKDVALVAPTITLQEQFYEVSECVYDPNTGGLSGTCPNVQQVDLSGMPSKTDVVNTGVGLNQWTQFPTITPGALDIQCANNQKLTLAPGQYNRLIMGRWCELTLTAGIYEFRSVETQTQDVPARIILATKDVVPPEKPDVVEFRVKEYLRLGHFSEVNKAHKRLLKIYVEGTDAASPPLWGGQSGPWTTFNFRGDGHFNACWVYSPNGTQTWRGNSKNIAGYNNSYYTQVFAQNVRHSLTDTLRIAFTHPQDQDCFDGAPPPPEVRCDYKIFSPSSLSVANGVVDAEVKISNVGSVLANVGITDTMDAKMTYRLSTSNIGEPTGGPPTYTFPSQPIAVSNSLILKYRVDINGLNANEQVCNNVQVTANGSTHQCRACVTRTEPPVPQCDYKTFSPSSLSDEKGVVKAEVKISNVGPGGGDVFISDTMGAKMTYRTNTSNIGEPTGGPPTYTFPVQPMSAGDSLLLTYQVNIDDLNVNEQVCNNVQITAEGTTDQCSACVTRTEEPPVPDVQCDYKIFSPSSLSDEKGIVNAQVQISNVGPVAANDVVITDTMGAKMTYRLNTSNIGNPAGGPPTYTFPSQSIAVSDSLILTYQVDINGLNANEQVCNNVQITVDGTTDQCSACVARTGPPVSVPAVGLWGLSVLVAVFAGMGGLLGYGRRKDGLMR